MMSVWLWPGWSPKPIRPRVGLAVAGIVSLMIVAGCSQDGQEVAGVVGTDGAVDQVDAGARPADADTGTPYSFDSSVATAVPDAIDAVDALDGIRLVSVHDGRCDTDRSWCEVERGQDAAVAGLGVQHRRLVVDESGEGSVDQLLAKALELEPDGIALSVAPDRPLRPETVDILNRTGTPIVVVGGGIDPASVGLVVAATIGQSDFRVGYEAGRLAIVDGAAGGACINGQPNVRRFDLRCQGYYEAMSSAGLAARALALPPDQAEAAELLHRFVDRFPDIDAYLSTGPAAARTTATVIAASPNATSVEHTTIDADLRPDGDLASNRLSRGIADEPYLRGFESIRTLTHLARYDLVPSNGLVSTRTGMLTPDEVRSQTSFDRATPMKVAVLLPARCENVLYWCPTEYGVRAAAAAHNVELTVFFVEDDERENADLTLHRAIRQGFDAFAVAEWDPEFLRISLGEAEEAGVPVVVFATGTANASPTVPVLTTIGHDEFQLGFAVGQRLLQESGSVRGLCLITSIGFPPADRRCAGFSEALSQAGADTAVVALGDDPARAAKRLESRLTEYPDTTAVFSTSSDVAAVMDGYLAKTDLERIKHATFGLSPDIADSVRDGRTSFVADVQPYEIGFDAISVLAMTLRGDRFPPEPVVAVKPRFVEKADVLAAYAHIGSVR